MCEMKTAQGTSLQTSHGNSGWKPLSIAINVTCTVIKFMSNLE